jgi:hypothetical protein
MNLEITKDERILLLRCLFSQTVLHDPEVKALANRMMEMKDDGSNGVRVPMGAVYGNAQPAGPAQVASLPSAGARKPEQLPDSVSQRRPASSSEPQRTPQTIQQVRMSSGKYDRESVEQVTVTPDKCERKEVSTGPFVKVSWPSKGRGFLTAACWDEELFPWVMSRVKQESVFYVVHKGKYTNIVGVKA